jgi:Nif-specific regulatory protein
MTPPLRDRAEDIEPLLIHFLNKVSKEYGRELYFAPMALELLKRHKWPGNVREMENLVERLVILSEGKRIDPELIRPYLPEHDADSAEPFPLGEDKGRRKLHSLKSLERQQVLAALERNHWIQQRAAFDLGITPRQIGYKIRKLGLAPMVAEKRARSRGE